MKPWTSFPLENIGGKQGMAARVLIYVLHVPEVPERKEKGRIETEGRWLAEGQEKMQISDHPISRTHTIHLNPTCPTN